MGQSAQSCYIANPTALRLLATTALCITVSASGAAQPQPGSRLQRSLKAATAAQPLATAYDLHGKPYTDEKIQAVESVSGGQVIGDRKRTGICHFPPNARNQNQVMYLDVNSAVAALLIKHGDFQAPPKNTKQYGYGCVLYGSVCETWDQEPCNLQGVCQSNNTCFCGNNFASCQPHATSSGCETNIGNDVNNCGTCGNECDEDEDACCAGVCSDLDTDMQNCGSCGFRCTSIPNVQDAVCSGGNCTVTCLQPQLTLCQTATGPFCANLNADPNFCGSCTTSCPADRNNHGTRTCNGTCGITCDRNFPTQCGDPAAGVSLCVDLSSSITTCGSCTTVCPQDPNAITICNQGNCVFTCTGGSTQCGAGGSPYCAFLLNDNLNCGNCGFVCNNQFTCIQGVCTNTNFATGKKLLGANGGYDRRDRPELTGGAG